MDTSDAARGLRLLGDPTRARILSLILGSPDGRQLVGRMADDLDLRQPTVSHHIKALIDDGILERVPRGGSVWYSIAPDQVDRMSELLRDADEVTLNSAVLERVAADLAARFVGVFAPETVSRYVRESYQLLAERAGITRYLPSLTARFAADRLSRPRPETDRAIADIPEVLFVCVQNAGRSQLASAILRSLAGDRRARLHRRLGARRCRPLRSSSPHSTRSAFRWAASSRSRSPTRSCAPPTS